VYVVYYDYVVEEERERERSYYYYINMSLSIVSPCLSLTSLQVNIKPDIQQTTIIPSLPSISINNISLLPFWSHFIIPQIQKHPHSTPPLFGPNLCFYSSSIIINSSDHTINSNNLFIFILGHKCFDVSG
jgi:hypothetical protein